MQTDSASTTVRFQANPLPTNGKCLLWLRKIRNLATRNKKKCCSVAGYSSQQFASSDSLDETSTVQTHNATAKGHNLATDSCYSLPRQLSYKLETSAKSCFGYLHCGASSLQEAMKLSRETGKPTFQVYFENGNHLREKALFSHPLLVEALENLFITVTVEIQNPGGSNSHLEGESCSSLIRVTNDTGTDLVPPICIFSATEFLIVDAMVRSLGKSEQSVPPFLSLLSEELLQQERSHRVIFTVHDAVLAEVDFAGLKGTIHTEVGFLETRERAIKVVFDPQLLRIALLARYAFAMANCTGKVFCQSNEERMAVKVEATRSTSQGFRKNPDATSDLLDNITFTPSYELKVILRRTPMRFVPLTELQCTRANRLIHKGKFHEATHLLSPRQGLILMDAFRKGDAHFHDVVGIPIRHAWEGICKGTCPRSFSQSHHSDTDSCLS